MTASSRRFFLATVSIFAGASALSGVSQVAEAAGVNVIRISQDMPASPALDTLMLMTEESRTKGPVFVLSYDNPSNPIYRKYQHVMSYVFKENGYNGTILLVDLRAHAALPLGHSFKIEKEERRVEIFATAIVNGEIINNVVTTSFQARGNSGKNYNVTLNGISISQEGRSDDEFKSALYQAVTKLYTGAFEKFRSK
ncbi:hypothetical protein [Azospirillum isscasi]|uniref:ABC transporter n=1 Tax=Azospirillum isscasi TaxID=3053926 RepID=A0ABU0WI41_9PROT|nr:hypothetical protein [Azospirillum isscasi]MDQ2103249.1 hypothetical protein [Azospirillum isscasi]